MEALPEPEELQVLSVFQLFPDLRNSLIVILQLLLETVALILPVHEAVPDAEMDKFTLMLLVATYRSMPISEEEDGSA